MTNDHLENAVSGWPTYSGQLQFPTRRLAGVPHHDYQAEQELSLGKTHPTCGVVLYFVYSYASYFVYFGVFLSCIHLQFGDILI